MEKNKISPRLSWIGGSVILFAIISTAAVSWILYEHTVNLLTVNLRQRLLSIAITQAANIDAKDIAVLQVENDWKKKEWAKTIGSLKRAKDNNPNIVFMYIFRKKKSDPLSMEFVADAESMNPYANTDADPTNDIDANGDGKIEPDGPDQLQWPGQDYASPPDEAFEAYNGPLTNRELYEDSYGQVLTGYAPIKDNNGQTVAVLGTDIKVDDFLIVTRQTLYPFLSFILFLVVAIVILSSVLIKLWNKRVEIFAELDRQKDELLGIVAHQLFTPVTAVRWSAEELLDQKSEFTKDQKDSLQTIQNQTAQLSDLISMILDVSRIQLGRVPIKREPLDLKRFFQEILEVIEIKAKERKVQFNVSIPKDFPRAELDGRYTRMTFENLLTNAVKYTKEGGKVDLDIQVNQNKLFFKVQDNGCGIPKADQDKIFGKLFRASNVRNTFDGNGFGLYVAQGSVTSQGGKIWFESEEGKGTTFYVELPLTEKTESQRG